MPPLPLSVLDLSPVFAGQATKVMRGFSFRGGKQVLVRDEMEGLKLGDNVRWAMVTGAYAFAQTYRLSSKAN